MKGNLRIFESSPVVPPHNVSLECADHSPVLFLFKMKSKILGMGKAKLL